MVHAGYDVDLQFNTINIWGLPSEPSDVKLNGASIDNANLAYDSNNKVASKRTRNHAHTRYKFAQAGYLQNWGGGETGYLQNWWGTIID